MMDKRSGADKHSHPEHKKKKKDPQGQEERGIPTEKAQEGAESPQAKAQQKQKMVEIAEHTLRELQEKAQELAEVKDNFLRRVADFENAKKRVIREKEEFAKFANEKIISSFLPVLDNLDRALSHSDTTETAEAVISGVNLIKKQIEGILIDNGLEKIEALGKQFDPHVHEAVGTHETDEHPAGTVIDEIQCGYLLKGRLLRPSWVRVAAAPKQAEGEQPPSADNDESSTEDPGGE